MARILVVDDEQMVTGLFRAVLGSHGHEVVTAASGPEALELFRAHRPDVAVLDLHMPEMNGIAVLQAIRAIAPQASVIILTGGDTEGLEQQARELGVTDFLRKGLSLDVLTGALERAFQAQTGSSAARAAGRRAESGAPEGSGEHATILVVDDEEIVRTLLTKFFTLRGYQVRQAANGPEALALVEQASPRMVILDMYMPGMNGVEVLRALRARHYTGGVVALTASQDERLLQQTLDLGSVDVLGKPVNLERLELVVQVGLVLSSADPSNAGPDRRERHPVQEAAREGMGSR